MVLSCLSPEKSFSTVTRQITTVIVRYNTFCLRSHGWEVQARIAKSSTPSHQCPLPSSYRLTAEFTSLQLYEPVSQPWLPEAVNQTHAPAFSTMSKSPVGLWDRDLLYQISSRIFCPSLLRQSSNTSSHPRMSLQLSARWSQGGWDFTHSLCRIWTPGD